MDQHLRIVAQPQTGPSNPSPLESKPPSPGGVIDLSIEEQRKRIYFSASLILAIPILMGYGLWSGLSRAEYLDGAVNIALAVIYLMLAVLLRKTNAAGMMLYRIGAVGLALMLIYCAGFGLYGESQLLWLMIFPMVVFYLFGGREGFFWIGAVLFASLLLIFFPAQFHSNVYDINFRIALCIALMLCIVFSYLLESLRTRFYHRLEEQSASLHNALADAKALKKLLPICASCKSVRNDEGYWQSVEHYIATQTNMTPSHGMCNRCLQREEPEVYETLLKAGKVKPVE